MGDLECTCDHMPEEHNTRRGCDVIGCTCVGFPTDAQIEERTRPPSYVEFRRNVGNQCIITRIPKRIADRQDAFLRVVALIIHIETETFDRGLPHAHEHGLSWQPCLGEACDPYAATRVMSEHKAESDRHARVVRDRFTPLITSLVQREGGERVITAFFIHTERVNKLSLKAAREELLSRASTRVDEPDGYEIEMGPAEWQCRPFGVPGCACSEPGRPSPFCPFHNLNALFGKRMVKPLTVKDIQEARAKLEEANLKECAQCGRPLTHYVLRDDGKQHGACAEWPNCSWTSGER